MTDRFVCIRTQEGRFQITDKKSTHYVLDCPNYEEAAWITRLLNLGNNINERDELNDKPTLPDAS